MEPSQVSTRLRRIAAGIDKCKGSVRPDLVTKDLRRVLAAMENGEEGFDYEGTIMDHMETLEADLKRHLDALVMQEGVREIDVVGVESIEQDTGEVELSSPEIPGGPWKVRFDAHENWSDFLMRGDDSLNEVGVPVYIDSEAFEASLGPERTVTRGIVIE